MQRRQCSSVTDDNAALLTCRPGDKFEAFRQQRSSGYYDMIGRNRCPAFSQPHRVMTCCA